MRRLPTLVLFCALATAAYAQVGEISLSAGESRFGDTSLGTFSSAVNAPKVTFSDGFRLAVRFTLNTYRFFGHEFGYAYSRNQLKLGAQFGDVSTPVHQGMYDFLVYATPEGSHVRPFAAGGVQFSSFFPPGTSVYSGNQITKFGVNFGGGIKFKVTPIFGIRLDARDYNSGKPDFGLLNRSGRLNQVEITGGLSFNF